MDEAMKARVEATLKNLKRNRMEAYYVDTKEQACDLVKTLVQPGATVSCGGSVTLKQTGVYDIIASSCRASAQRLQNSGGNRRSLPSGFFG